MNSKQRITLIIGCCVLTLALLTTPRYQIVQGMRLKGGEITNLADQYDFQAALIRTLAVVGLTAAGYLCFSKKKVQNDLASNKESTKKKKPLSQRQLNYDNSENVTVNSATFRQPSSTPEYQDNRGIAEKHYSQGLSYKRSGNSHEAIESIKKAARLGHKEAREFLTERKIVW